MINLSGYCSRGRSGRTAQQAFAADGGRRQGRKPGTWAPRLKRKTLIWLSSVKRAQFSCLNVFSWFTVAFSPDPTHARHRERAMVDLLIFAG
jgi:hypothetical protein